MTQLIRIEAIDPSPDRDAVQVTLPTLNVAMRVFSPDEAVRVAEYYARIAGTREIVRGALPPAWHQALERYPLEVARGRAA